MKEILLQIMGVVLLIGTSVTPAWDMPKDASCEAQNAVYAEEAKEIEEVDENTDSVDESGDESLEYIGTFEMTAYEWTGSLCQWELSDGRLHGRLQQPAAWDASLHRRRWLPRCGRPWRGMALRLLDGLVPGRRGCLLRMGNQDRRCLHREVV